PSGGSSSPGTGTFSAFMPRGPPMPASPTASRTPGASARSSMPWCYSGRSTSRARWSAGSSSSSPDRGSGPRVPAGGDAGGVAGPGDRPAAPAGPTVVALAPPPPVQARTFSLAWSEYPSWSTFGVASDLGLINGAAGKLGKIEQKWNVDIRLELLQYDPCITS